MPDPEIYIDDFLATFPQDELYVACSGGVDSMVLLDLVRKSGRKVHVLHVNYMLRGADSEGDMQLVESYCAEHAIPFHLLRSDLKTKLETLGGNLQDEARKVRYAFFEEFLVEPARKVLLAHHADDQMETFFLQLARKAGVMGLAAMQEQHGNYLRPLLHVTREEIARYAVKNKVPWRDDQSNFSNKYQRNLLRNVILPFLKKEIPAIQESVLQLVSVFQETQLDLEKKLRPIVEKIREEGKLDFETFDEFEETEKIELLRQLDLSFSLLTELEKLRVGDKGRFIAFENSFWDEIIRESDHFYFLKESAFILPELVIEPVDKLPDVFSKQVIFLDPDKLPGELKLRLWQLGDRIQPVGMKGSRLISDILTDAKIPHAQRKNQVVLTAGDTILWCVNQSVSGSALANADSTKILRCSIKKAD